MTRDDLEAIFRRVKKGRGWFTPRLTAADRNIIDEIVADEYHHQIGVRCNVCRLTWKGQIDQAPSCLSGHRPPQCPFTRRLQIDPTPHEIAPPAVSLSVEWQCPVCKVGVMGLAPPQCMADTEPANCPRAAAPAMVIP